MAKTRYQTAAWMTRIRKLRRKKTKARGKRRYFAKVRVKKGTRVATKDYWLRIIRADGTNKELDAFIRNGTIPNRFLRSQDKKPSPGQRREINRAIRAVQKGASKYPRRTRDRKGVLRAMSRRRNPVPINVPWSGGTLTNVPTAGFLSTGPGVANMESNRIDLGNGFSSILNRINRAVGAMAPIYGFGPDGALSK